MRVLVVDDDATSRRVLEGSLVRRGYDVVTASGGAEAWRVFQGEKVPQLAIIDWMMPDVDGPEVCSLVRGFHPDQNNGTVPILNLPPIWIILLTSKGAEHAAGGLASGANDYLAKPYRPGELLARLQVGEQAVIAQSTLMNRVSELELALSQAKAVV